MHLAVSAYLYVCILAYVNLQFLNLLCCNFVFIANGVWPLRNKTITCLLTYFYLLPKSVNKIISKIIQYYMKLRGIRWRLHSKDKWVIFGNCCMYSLSEIGSFCHWFLCFFLCVQIRSLCNVRYRKFDFFGYPEHVQNLHTYAFKPIIIEVSLIVHLFVYLFFFVIYLLFLHFCIILNKYLYILSDFFII